MTADRIPDGMSGRIDVSVIIPVYNGERHIAQCVRSVTAQTLESIEIILVDDGSTDGTAKILAQLAEEDARIRVIAQENAGAGAARNRGLDSARGEYLSFLDADDFFEPDMLAAALDAARRDGAQIVIFGSDFYDEKRKRFAPCRYGIRSDLLPAHRPFAGEAVGRCIFECAAGWAWDKLFEARYIRESGLRFQAQRTSNDLYFVYAAMTEAQRITTLERVLAHQRRGAGPSLSVTREKSFLCFYDALEAIRERLREKGLYARFEQDYINYALHFALWNVNTLREPQRRALCAMLLDRGFEALGVKGYPKARFYHRSEYLQYRLLGRMMDHPQLMNAAGLAQRALVYLRRRLRRGI